MSTDGPSHEQLQQSIEAAADSVGPVWPLHSFVTANPLAGFEDQPFHEAVRRGERLFGGRGYPSADVLRRALESGQIDEGTLTARLADHGYEEDPETLLAQLAADEEPTGTRAGGDDAGASATDRVDAVVSKWLAAFLDQGSAEWPMPDREQGFYAAFRTVARYDRDIPDRRAVAEYPDDPLETIQQVVEECPADWWETVLESHLTALPGWTGLVRQREAAGDEWQAAAPVTIVGYLAVRLVLTDLFDAPVAPPDTGATADDPDGEVPIEEVWLDAWEATYRDDLVDDVAAAGRDDAGDAGDDDRPAAQLAFCIDTRSEVVRRHVEAAGEYETHGYAGFFGVPMRYEGYDAETAVDACPPIVDAQHRIVDRPTDGHEHEQASHDRWARVREAGSELVESLASNAATAFSFVESAGAGYGLALAARTLLPTRVSSLLGDAADRVPDAHEFCETTVDHDPAESDDLPLGLTTEEQVKYAATAFELMGIEEFARVVAFVGHASRTTNEPFAAGLDCGACAGNPGGPNARVLAAICNDETVRERLRDRGIDVPDDTVFVAGEHTTTTDEVTLYAEDVPESHAADVASLRADLETARAGAAAERAETMGVEGAAGVRETERRAADWAETRPEWGLAGNAGFVVGPRALTADLDLGGRCFLHSYDPTTDPDGSALEAILTGPMVVTQWINNQYYFSTVDTGVYGSGSKVTHNPVGNVGVYQGNGGDIATGLPLQSVRAGDDDPHHQPLRLSVVVCAPVERVTAVLERHDNLVTLLDNGWLSLTVLDPEQEFRRFDYDGGLTWVSGREQADASRDRTDEPVHEDPAVASTPVASDD